VSEQWRHQALVNVWPSSIDDRRQYIILFFKFLLYFVLLFTYLLSLFTVGKYDSEWVKD